MAIIDILTHYDAKKKAAHAAKTVKHGVSADTVTLHIDPSFPLAHLNITDGSEAPFVLMLHLATELCPFEIILYGMFPYSQLVLFKTSTWLESK